MTAKFLKWLFLSTPSARRATLVHPVYCISKKHFYPRPPRGGRRGASSWQSPPPRFLSTPSARRATTQDKIATLTAEFLSTPSARRATLSLSDNARSFRGFLSTPSARRATQLLNPAVIDFQISIHALREEGDQGRLAVLVFDDKFLSTPSARRATTSCQLPSTDLLNFYPRPPRGGRRVLL